MPNLRQDCVLCRDGPLNLNVKKGYNVRNMALVRKNAYQLHCWHCDYSHEFFHI